jgi:phosphoribosylaminoimidazolecarboxamide formyltransferase/IMP cyclohydrolase
VFVPEITDGAIAMLRRKRDKCKVLVNPALGCLGLQSLDTAPRIRQVRGGFLMQPNYRFVLRMDDPALVNIGNVDTEQMSSLLLAWAVGSTSNSNTITLVRDSYLIGNGVGQQSRVSAAKLALMRARDAGHSPSGAVAYSDSFFPFIDGPKILGEAGIRAVLTSSGSVNDAQVIKAFQEWGVKVLMIPDKVGRGFSHH